ncbi:MAG: thiamine pyrophosphate-dependent dehydrogenase E1 component subunit alpha [Myxococcota bacterium]
MVAQADIGPKLSPPNPEPRLFRVLDPEGRVVGPMPAIPPETVRAAYENMVQIRLLDERMMILQRQGRIGFYGACTGQEAPPIGTTLALEPSDWIFPALREGVAMLVRGYDLETYISQVFGNARDVLKGRQMPSHYADRSVNSVSWSSCIATQLPQAVGAAWAAKIKKDRTVTVGFMGDGATSEGDFHYALNFAGVYKVPCILICQNNHWSISVPTERQTRARSIAEKALAYGLPFARVDGNDLLAVWAAVKEAADRARRGEGATFLEMLTYRIGAHSSSDDPRVYRDEREVEEWKKRDPLERLNKYLVSIGAWDAAEEQALRSRLDAKIKAAVERAEAHPPPRRETVFEDVYKQVEWHIAEQRDEFLRLAPAPVE